MPTRNKAFSKYFSDNVLQKELVKSRWSRTFWRNQKGLDRHGIGCWRTVLLERPEGIGQVWDRMLVDKVLPYEIHHA